MAQAGERSLVVLTVATEEQLASRLIRSCRERGVPLVTLGKHVVWGGFCTKYRLVLEYLEAAVDLDDHALVVFSDGYDTVCQAAGPSAILQAYARASGQSSNDAVVVSAEMYLWPPATAGARSHFDALYTSSSLSSGKRSLSEVPLPPPARYPCSGQWAASKKAALSFLRRVYKQDDADDQEALIWDMVSSPAAVYVLDYDCLLFQANVFHLTDHRHGTEPDDDRSTHEMMNCMLSFGADDDDDELRLRNLWTDSTPCFLHTNGSGGGALDDCMEGYREPLQRAAHRGRSSAAYPRAVQLGPAYARFAPTYFWRPVSVESVAEGLAVLSEDDTNPEAPRVLLEGELVASNDFKGGAALLDRVIQTAHRALAVSDYDVVLLSRTHDPSTPCSQEEVADGLVVLQFPCQTRAVMFTSAAAVRRIAATAGATAVHHLTELVQVLFNQSGGVLASEPPLLVPLPGKDGWGPVYKQHAQLGTKVPVACHYYPREVAVKPTCRRRRRWLVVIVASFVFLALLLLVLAMKSNSATSNLSGAS